jgi:hypothetical protein
MGGAGAADRPEVVGLEWEGLEECVLQLRQPSGAPRPPSVRLELWDDELPREQPPLAVGDVRLSSVGGRRTLTAARDSQESLRDVEVAFLFEVKDLPRPAGPSECPRDS